MQRPRKTIAEQIAALKEAEKKAQARIAQLEAREKTAERKRDTRRKIIVGALAIEHRDKNPQDAFTKKLNALLDEYVLRPADRGLFGLPVKSEDAAKEKTTKTPNPENGAA